MRLRNKVLGVIGLLWVSFIVVAYIGATHSSIFSYILLVIGFSLLLLWLLHTFVLKRVEQLNDEIADAQFNRSASYRVHVEGNDEFSQIALEVNQMLDKIQLSQKQLAAQDEQQNNIEEEINSNIELASVEKEFNSDRDPVSRFAHYDSLVALPNRVLFNEMLNKSISHAKRHNKILAILIIDVAPLQHSTPSLTHNLGDYAIKEIGNRLVNILRTEDIIAKLDGNEFIILLNDIGKTKFASAVAEKISQAVIPAINIDYHELFLKASIGICIYPHDGYSLEDLIQKAYSALYKAKNMSDSAYQFYTSEMDVEAREYIRLETDLRKAIQNNELTLYYQPKLNIKTGDVAGVEALIRWMHPDLGIISPVKFIEVAEDTGFIMQIGEWALREACKMNKYWQDEGYEHLTMALNLSPKQFNNPDIIKVIASVINDTGLNPNYLELEIHESTIMDNLERATTILEQIKEIGVHISIDHFGTGYTSISHLKMLPVSVVKIDRGFIKGIPNNPDDSAITSAIIALAHNLGLEVVGEGIETAEQVEYLAIQHCDMVQGYFLSYPLPAQKVTEQFKKLMDKVIV